MTRSISTCTLPMDKMLVHHTVGLSLKRGTVRIKFLVQEHNTMSSTRARTQTAHSGVERTNREATGRGNKFIWGRSAKRTNGTGGE